MKTKIERLRSKVSTFPGIMTLARTVTKDQIKWNKTEASGTESSNINLKNFRKGSCL